MKTSFKYILFFLLLIAGKISYAQDWNLTLEMVITDESKNMGGAEVNVFRDGQLVEKLISNAKGRVDVKLKPNGVYTVAIGGNNNYIKKKLEINTNGVPPEAFTSDIYFPAEVDIFKKLDGLDYDILNQPIGKIAFQADVASFDVDREYTKQMQSELANLEEDYLAQKKKEAALEKQKQKDYDIAIKKADVAFKSQNWEEAELEYKKASALKPLETYPSFQLAELQTKLIEIRKTNERYDAAIKKADEAFASKDFKTAMAEYKTAGGYKPNEAYPKTKLEEVQSLLTASAKTDQDYLAAIEKGDNSLKVSELETAKTAFEEASKLKPTESYPKNKLAEINSELSKKQKKEADYLAAIKSADDALASTEYTAAKSAYEKAQGLKPSESYPAKQIEKIATLMAEAAKTDQEYIAAVQKGENALDAKTYDVAIAAFEEASAIKSTEEYPKNKIKEIKDFIAKSAANDKAYQDNITAADKALGNKEYESAKSAYQAALKLKPKESYPQSKITEIENTLAGLAKKEENYKAAIEEGDNAMKSKDFTAAKTAYNNALGIKADEKYPKDKISEIEGIQKQLESAQAAYAQAIKNGDEAFTAKNYEAAKQSYQEATQLKTEEQYPKDKLSEIDKTMAQLAEKENAYSKAIQEGDNAKGTGNLELAKTNYSAALAVKPDASYPKQQIDEINKRLAEKEKNEADYQTAIVKADKALDAKNYQEATSAYQAALKIKEDDYPKGKMKEIEGLLSAEKEKIASYQVAIDKGDKAFEKKDWENAKSAYQEALGIKKDDYPSTQISAIDSEIAKEKAGKEALAKKEADYQKAISDGDAKLSSNQLEAALGSFQNASQIKPEEAYPKGKISDIQEEIKKRADKAAAEVALAAIEKQYQDLISKADVEMKNKNLDQARKDYQAALVLKSEENYPQSKIDEINATLADAEKQEASYQTAVKNGDKLLAKEDLNAAKEQYSTAISIKPNEQYPKGKLKEIEDKLAAIAEKEAELLLNKEKSAALNEQYKQLITAADDFFNGEQYDDAKNKYQAALALKSEDYPQQQIEEIGKKLAALENEKADVAAKVQQAKIDAEYQSLVTAADDFFNAKKFEEAKTKYQAALVVKNEVYPQQQIDKIGEKLAAIEQSKEEEDAAKAKAQKEAQYQALIAEGDALLNDNKLIEAKDKFIDALGLKEDSYPANKIAEIDRKMEQLAAANAAKGKLAEVDKQYKEAIQLADQYASNKDYGNAISSYQTALTLKEKEQYPADKINELKEILAENSSKEAQIEAKYQTFIATADKALDENNLTNAKTNYNNALALKGNETYPKTKIKEIDDLLAKQAKNADEIRIQKEQEAKNEAAYQQTIVNADQLLKENKLKEARNEYQLALGLKSSEKYPQEQTNKIDKLLQKMADGLTAAKDKKAQEAALAEDYKVHIESGDKAIVSNQYHLAKREYQSALDIKPKETYPQQQLKKVNDILVKKEAEESASKQLADKPIEIRKGERVGIDSDAEDKIDQMYQEIWAKNKAEKSQKIEDKEKAVKELSNQKREEGFSNRKNAIEKIEDISISLQKQNKEATEYNLQNYETIKEKEKALKKNSLELEKNDERFRNEVYAQKDDYSKSQRAFNEKINTDRKGVKEKVEEDYQEHNESLAASTGEQRERMGIGKTHAEEKAESIREYSKERSNEQQDNGKETLLAKEEGLKETTIELRKEHEERIGVGKTKVEQKAEVLREYSQQKSTETLNTNQQNLQNKTEGIKETQVSFEKSSQERTNEKQQEINELTLSQKQNSADKNESFKKGQNEIEQKEKDLKEVQLQLEESAKNSREKNADKEYYRGEDKPRQDQDASKYPQGITEKIIEGNNSTTIQRIVVNGTQVDIYEKTLYNYGSTFYTKNGTNITEEVWDKESK